MNKIAIVAAVAALTMTTGFTCSKNAPTQAAPAPTAPAPQEQMAAPAAPAGQDANAQPAQPPPAQAAPAPTETK